MTHRPQPPVAKRPSYAEELAVLVDELTSSVTTRERWLRDPDKTTRRRVFTDHPLVHAGLLADLEAAMRPARMPVDEPGHSSAFSSRAPVRHEALELIDEITTGAAALRREMRGAGRRRADASTVESDLRALVGLVADPATNAEAKLKTLRQVRAWVQTARVIVSHDAPVMTLRDTNCAYCGGDLRVRADASSDVWCSGMVRVVWCSVNDHVEHKELQRVECADENGKRYTWPHSSWLMLLDRLEEATG